MELRSLSLFDSILPMFHILKLISKMVTPRWQQWTVPGWDSRSLMLLQNRPEGDLQNGKYWPYQKFGVGFGTVQPDIALLVDFVHKRFQKCNLTSFFSLWYFYSMIFCRTKFDIYKKDEIFGAREQNFGCCWSILKLKLTAAYTAYRVPSILPTED